MEFTKEVVLPVALSEVLGRIFSFLFDSFSRAPDAGTARDAHRRRLERLLGNIGSMVEEAEGRHITNLQLLSHLKALTEGMFRGRFALDVTDLDDVKNAGGGDDDDDAGGGAEGKDVRRSFALCSSFNRAKRSRVTSLIFGGGGGGGDGTERLAAVVEELEYLTHDYMREFILLVQGYPRKKERIVDFLVQRPPGGAPYLSVLVVVGAKKLGKTTLVKHACDDERVRDHFARIEWFETPDVVREGGSPPKFTVQDVLCARAAGDGGSEDGFTVHLCRETLYMDHWYSITFKVDSRSSAPQCCDIASQ
ncbi:hypothetical protein GUJ93_ZPchr0006g44540 [Zizania palustris]|uniref:Rx N-terminal domain-containing protein n=1 Tax=Zizania palustris TaxID=103762 RepID=A0A8J5T5A0_ZIZPA|nr:hypothetical protein GUJ93_ZPchr0006g44540 [Zizania palustris]